MEKFAPDSKWKLKVKLDFEILFQDFPISMEASLIFQADSEMKVLCKPWLRTQLTSCDFLVIKSSMAIQESESKFFTDKELSFQDFLEATNNQRLLNISGTKEMKSVTVNVDKTNKLFLESAENTLYVQVLDSPMTLILDKEAGKITIRGGDLEQILGLKQDLLQCGEKSVSLGQIRQLQECLEDDNLDLCYKMLRLLWHTIYIGKKRWCEYVQKGLVLAIIQKYPSLDFVVLVLSSDGVDFFFFKNFTHALN